MYQSLRRLRSLSFSKTVIVFQLLLLVPVVEVCLYLFGFSRTYRLLSRLPACVDAAAHKGLIQPYRWAYSALTRRGWLPGRCLSQSLALRWLLLGQGVNPDLQFGAQWSEQKINAHAWLEYKGIPINDRTDVAKRFVPFERPITPPDNSTR